MIPKILEYEDNRIKVTPQAYAIPEIKALLDKYDMDAEPYLMFVYAMSAPDSPYCNISKEEKLEGVLYDIQTTLGQFNWEDPLVEDGIAKFKSLYQTPIVLLAEELAEELTRIRHKLSNEEIEMGPDGNFKERVALLKDISKIANEYEVVRKKADEELNPGTKGDHELGEY